MAILQLNLCSVSGTLPSGQLSAIPWRRSSVKYTNNEAYFDVIEEVDASKFQTMWNIYLISLNGDFTNCVYFQLSTNRDKRFLQKYRDT